RRSWAGRSRGWKDENGLRSSLEGGPDRRGGCRSRGGGRGHPDGPGSVHVTAARPAMACLPGVARAFPSPGRDRPRRRRGGPPGAVVGAVPPFSDITFDDSGYATAIRFSGPIADPTSLEQVAASVVGRVRRGIAYLEERLAALPPGAPTTPAMATNIRQ